MPIDPSSAGTRIPVAIPDASAATGLSFDEEQARNSPQSETHKDDGDDIPAIPIRNLPRLRVLTSGGQRRNYGRGFRSNNPSISADWNDPPKLRQTFPFLKIQE